MLPVCASSKISCLNYLIDHISLFGYRFNNIKYNVQSKCTTLYSTVLTHSVIRVWYTVTVPMHNCTSLKSTYLVHV